MISETNSFPTNCWDPRTWGPAYSHKSTLSESLKTLALVVSGIAAATLTIILFAATKPLTAWLISCTIVSLTTIAHALWQRCTRETEPQTENKINLAVQTVAE